MSLLTRLGMSIGIGSVQVSVAPVDAAQFRGGIARGVLLLTGGAGEIELMMLTVDLTEFWVTGSGKSRTYHARNHGRVTLAEKLLVSPEFRQEYPFEFGLPADARCSRRREGWSFDAEAHIAMAVDARSRSFLKVVPHPEVLAVQRAARDLLGLIPVMWDGSREQVFYDFRSPDWLSGMVEGVTFRLTIVGDQLNGEMIANRQEHGVGDMFRAIVGADKQVIPFSIPRSELISRRGTPRPAGAVAFLREAFHQLGVDVPAPPAALSDQP